MFEDLIHVSWAECLKLRRSRAPVMTGLAAAMAPVATALLMLASSDPARAGSANFITLESQISLVQADWPRYLIALSASSAVAGLSVFSLLMIWIFGREHADQTSKELLTMPIPRELFALGKILVASLWCLVLQLGMLALGLALGASLGLPSWSWALLLPCLLKFLSVFVLVLCVATPFGFIANLSRGTMAAVGLLFLSLFFALIMNALGWGAYFPWSIPALSGAGASLGTLSYGLVFATGLASVLGHMIWWRRADQH